MTPAFPDHRFRVPRLAAFVCGCLLAFALAAVPALALPRGAEAPHPPALGPAVGAPCGFPAQEGSDERGCKNSCKIAGTRLVASPTCRITVLQGR